ncbi:MAG: four-carbon acid sugar kinase family protein, partial [Elusimicrobiota bacterium]|nr:four-carbon acid sugar kinase family protein [Elusimicrobiota bacterium]
MKKNKILVFCDDLTGCGDIAYWALALNLDFLKQKSINFDYLKNIDLDLKNFLKDYDIFIINTESRSDNEKILKNKMNIIIDFLQNNEFYKNFEFIFKKIDSTLRGNFALEINEMIEKFDMNFVPFIAAYPEYDRFTRNGYHYINNVLLQDTIFAKDPKNPIKESKISTIIYNQLGLSKNLKKFEIYDVQNFYELEKNVKSILEKENRNIKFYAGSSRFFGEILKQKQKFYTKIAKKCNFFIQNKNNSRNKKYENFLVIAGSFNEQTKSQLQYF